MLFRKLIGGGSEGGRALAKLVMKTEAGDDFAQAFLKTYVLQTGLVINSPLI